MEIYEKIQIEIEFMSNEDVITTSTPLEPVEHDNMYLGFDLLE